MEKNSVPVFRLMVALFLVLKLCVKEILVVLFCVTSTGTSHFLVSYHDRHHSKITVVCKGILACLSTFTIFPNGFEKVFNVFFQKRIKYFEGFPCDEGFRGNEILVHSRSIYFRVRFMLDLSFTLTHVTPFGHWVRV